MINIDEYFKKYSNLYQFEEGNPEYLIDKEDFKAAIKEIVGQVLELASVNAEFDYGGYEAKSYNIIGIDKQSILGVKNLIEY